MTHFKEVIVPEIQKRQVQGIHKTKTVGELLGDLVVVAPLHVVCSVPVLNCNACRFTLVCVVFEYKVSIGEGMGRL